MGRQTNAYAELVSSVIKDARDSSGGMDAFLGKLQPMVGSVSADSVEGWIRGRHNARADVFLAAAQLAGYGLREQVIQVRMNRLEAEMMALRSQTDANAS